MLGGAAHIQVEGKWNNGHIEKPQRDEGLGEGA